MFYDKGISKIWSIFCLSLCKNCFYEHPIFIENWTFLDHLFLWSLFPGLILKLHNQSLTVKKKKKKVTFQKYAISEETIAQSLRK